MDFNDLGGFLAHFATRAAAVDRMTSAALNRAATIVQQDAKKRIGRYQPQVGPHPGWAPLTEETMDQREKLGFTANDPLLRTGELRDSVQKELVSGQLAIVGSKLPKAAGMEFGGRNTPARPFIGPAAFANKDKIQKLIGTAAVAGLYGGGRVHEALGYDIDIE